MNLSLLKKKNPFDFSYSGQQTQQPQDSGDDDGQDTENDNDEDDADTQDDSDSAATSAADDTEEQPSVAEPLNPTPLDPAPPDQQTAQPNRFQNIYNQMVNQPQGPMTRRFSDYLSQPPPTKEQYKPSKMNRLGAILGGASEAYFRGPGAGLKYKEAILDRPYQEAMNRHVLLGKQLEQAAGIESKNLGRAASVARTATTAETAAETNRIKAIQAETQARHLESADATAAANAVQRGWKTHTNPVDGHLIFSKPKPDGTIQTVDGGKAGESLSERAKRILEEKVAVEGVIQKRQLAVTEAAAAARSKLADKENEARKEAALELAAQQQTRDNKNARTQQQLIKDRGEQTRTNQANKPSETTETKVTDAQGNVAGTKTTTKKKGDNKISVIRLSDGLSGTIDEKDFDPAKYKRQ
jgi:hypothetical protein